MNRRRVRITSLASAGLLVALLGVGCGSTTTPEQLSGTYTARVVPHGSEEAAQIRSALQATDSLVISDQDIAVITVTWKLTPPKTSKNCLVVLAESHPATWGLFVSVLDNPLQGGTDPSMADAPSKFPDAFRGLPSPDLTGQHQQTQSMFTASTKQAGTSRIIYYLDPTRRPAPTDVTSVVAVFECAMKAQTATRLTQRS